MQTESHKPHNKYHPGIALDFYLFSSITTRAPLGNLFRKMPSIRPCRFGFGIPAKDTSSTDHPIGFTSDLNE